MRENPHLSNSGQQFLNYITLKLLINDEIFYKVNTKYLVTKFQIFKVLKHL